MTSPARADTPTRLPLWLKAALSGQAALQWLLVRVFYTQIAAARPFLGVPMVIVRPILVTGGLLLTLAAVLAWALPERGPLAALYARWQRLPARWLAVIAGGLVLLGLVSLRFYTIYYLLTASQLLLMALVLLGAHPLSRAQQPPHVLRWAAIGVVVIALGLRLWFLFVDHPWIDEGHWLSLAAAMQQERGIVPLLMQLPPEIRLLPYWGVGNAIYGLWAKVVGLGLFRMRALAYLVGLVALPFQYGTIRLWYDRRTALIGTALSALSYLFLQSIIARNTALPMLAMSMTVFLHVYATHQERLRWHVLAGAVGALALETHLTNATLLFAMGMVYLIAYGRGIRSGEGWLRRAPLWAFLGGAIPVLALLIAAHLGTFPYPARYDYMGAAATYGGIFTWLSRRAFLMRQLLSAYWLGYPLEALVIVAAIVAAILRRTDADRHWLMLLGFTLLGYAGLAFNADVNYTIIAWPLFMAGTGALITRRTMRHAPPPGRAPELLLYTAVTLALMANSMLTINVQAQNQADFVRNTGPIIEAINTRLPADAPLIGPAVLYPYLTTHTTYIEPQQPGVLAGPALTGTDPDRYWQDVLLRTWPRARITTQVTFPQVAVFDNYMHARHMLEVVPGLWLAQDDGLVTRAEAANSTAALTLAAHAPLPDTLTRGDTLGLYTIWITREAITRDHIVTVALHDGAGQVAATHSAPMVRDWTGTATHTWETYRFHDVRARLPLPLGLPPDQYSLHISVEAASDGPAACQPGCLFELGTVTVER